MTRPFPSHALALGAALTAALAVGWMFLSTPSVTTASGSGDAVAGTDARTGLLHRLFGGGDGPSFSRWCRQRTGRSPSEYRPHQA